MYNVGQKRASMGPAQCLCGLQRVGNLRETNSLTAAIWMSSSDISARRLYIKSSASRL